MLAKDVALLFLSVVPWLAVPLLGRPLDEEETAENDRALRAGAAAVALEATDDMVIGGGIGPGGATGQEGDLRAAALVVGLEEERLAIVACDILMIRRDYLDAAARRIEEEVGIPFENVLINATHTHHAPSTVTIHDYARDESFCGEVRDAVVEAARRAARRLEESGPVEMRFRLGQEATVGENSRLLLSDGTIWWTGKADDVVRPTGPFDPELPVIVFRRPDGIEARLFNHSTHLIGTHRPGVRSPSFYGLAAQRLEDGLGGTAIFLSGAYGSTHNRRLDYLARDWGRNLLESLKPDTVLLPAADHSTFPAIYLQVVEGVRPDVVIANKYRYIEDRVFRASLRFHHRELRGVVHDQREPTRGSHRPSHA